MNFVMRTKFVKVCVILHWWNKTVLMIFVIFHATYFFHKIWTFMLYMMILSVHIKCNGQQRLVPTNNQISLMCLFTRTHTLFVFIVLQSKRRLYCDNLHVQLHIWQRVNWHEIDQMPKIFFDGNYSLTSTLNVLVCVFDRRFRVQSVPIAYKIHYSLNNVKILYIGE